MADNNHINNDSRYSYDPLFHLFLNHAPGLVWILNKKAELIFANEAFYQFFKLSSQSLDVNISDILPASVADKLYANHLLVIETGRPAEVSEMLSRNDGTSSVFHISSFPIVTEMEETLVGSYATNLINEYSSEIKLKEVNEQLALLKKTSTDAIWEWDLRTGQVYRNEILVNLIGYKPEKEQGLAWWLRRIHPEDRDIVSEKIKTITDHGQKSWEIEYRFRCANDNYKNINDHGFVIYENGFPVKLVGALKEISSTLNFL